MSDFKVQARVVRVVPVPEPFSGRLFAIRFEPPPEGVNFDGAVLEDVDFSGMRVDRYYVRGSTFDRCDFSRSVLRVGTFSVPPSSVYRDCRFDRADLRQCNPGLARFERCSFEKAKFGGWNATGAEFIDCRFAGLMKDVTFSAGMERDPDLYEIAPEHLKRFHKPRGEPLEFRGNDFTNADLENVDFIGGIDLDAQQLPDDPAFVRLDVRPETLARVESCVRSLPAEEQAKPLRLLGWLRGRYRNQPEAFTKSFGDSTFGLYRELLGHLRND
jgi:hypothetical protein